jgi:hypothetical protein
VPPVDQPWNKPGANRTARSDYEDFHRVLLSSRPREFAGLSV